MLTRWTQNIFARSLESVIAAPEMTRIADAISQSESQHLGQICFAIERSLSCQTLYRNVSTRDRAAKLFAKFRIWDTERNNGVLLYLLTSERRIEIIADRGFNGKVSVEQWRGVCQLMEERLAAGDAVNALLLAIAEISSLIAEHYPRGAHDVSDNELPNVPYVL